MPLRLWLSFLLISAAASAQQQISPEQLRIAPAVADGLLVHSVEPQYPQEAHGMGGHVRVRFVIDMDGSTTGVIAEEGHPLLRDAAVNAVKQFKYKPYLIAGEPARAETFTTINFYLEPPKFPGKADSEKRLRVSQGVMDSHLTHRVAPDYPLEAQSRHIQGTVLLAALIDREGRIADLNPLEGDPMLVRAAVAAVSQWLFRPMTVKGEPFDTQTTIKIEFRM